MNYNSKLVYKILLVLNKKMLNLDFVTDKSGVKLLLILDGKYIIDPKYGHHLKIENEDTGYVFMLSNELYIALLSEWHKSRQLNINMVNHVKIWQQVSSTNGLINSNYGWCVFDPANGSLGKSQFEHCVETLKNHKESRQALIIYTRPTMHTDSKRDGMHDFLCTISNQFLIRNNKLEMIYTMKGQDVFTGLKNNVAWAMLVYNEMLNKLKLTYPELTTGTITFNVGSLHLYENKFKKLKKLFSN